MSVQMAEQRSLDGSDTRTWFGGLYYWRTVEERRAAEGKPRPKHYLSDGKGTQTSCLKAMSQHGLIQPPLDAAFFGDTQNEPGAVHRYAKALEPHLDFEVVDTFKASLLADEFKVHTNANGEPYLKTNIPVWTYDASKPPKKRIGRAMRKCTFDYKIRPVQLAMERHAGIKPGSAHEEEIIVWMGITTDEAHRADPSKWGRAANRFPLLELGMSRQDCIDWMKENGYGEPPRSACVGCPNRTDTGWQDMKENRPSEFRSACNFERHLQRAWAKIPRLSSVPFLHGSCKPLGEVDFVPVPGERHLVGCLEGVCEV